MADPRDPGNRPPRVVTVDRTDAFKVSLEEHGIPEVQWLALRAYVTRDPLGAGKPTAAYPEIRAIEWAPSVWIYYTVNADLTEITFLLVASDGTGAAVKRNPTLDARVREARKLGIAAAVGAAVKEGIRIVWEWIKSGGGG
jgi:hypothetical protein